METSYKQIMRNIKAFAFDIDGVMTDGSLLLINGEQVRTMNIKDGYALGLAVKSGYSVFVLSAGAPSESVRKRLEHLGITEIHLGVKDKKTLFAELMQKHGHTAAETAYMGDDLPDFEVLEIAGLKCCPSDAVSQIKVKCDFISSYAGGDGCVRDLIEQVLRLHGRWPFVNS
ncbi:MAG: KdsC family phosphatase [Flavobacteriales bacterium]